jgi:hypothetical protein
MSSPSNQPERIVFHELSETYLQAERDREALRRRHGLTLVSEQDDGTGIHRLPEGVFGFTYAPCLSDSPLFRKTGLRAFEVHKHSGDEFVIGFVDPASAEKLKSSAEPFELDLFPGPEATASQMVEVPTSRVLHYKLHSQREFGALHLRISPAL